MKNEISVPKIPEPSRWKISELLLLLVPLFFLGGAWIFWKVRQQNAPFSISSVAPVRSVYALDEERFLTVEMVDVPQAAKPQLPIVCVYERKTGARLRQRVWPNFIDKIVPSPDGKHCFFHSFQKGFTAKGVVNSSGVFRVSDLEILAGATIDGALVRWSEPNRLEAKIKYPESALKTNRQPFGWWKVENGILNFSGKSMEKELEIEPQIAPPSKKWRVEVKRGEYEPRTLEHEIRPSGSYTSRFWTKEVFLHASRSPKAKSLGIYRLRAHSDEAWGLSDDGRKLLMLKPLHNALPPRYDFLHIDSQTQEKRAVRLQDIGGQPIFEGSQFIADGQLWAGQTRDFLVVATPSDGNIVKQINKNPLSGKNRPENGKFAITPSGKTLLQPMENGVDIYDLERWVR